MGRRTTNNSDFSFDRGQKRKSRLNVPVKKYIYIYLACYGSLFRWDLKYRDQILDRSPANLPRKKNEINRSRGGDLGMINISKISPP